MQRLGWLVIALCAMQVTSMPVLNEMSPDDTRVMKCVVEVISDTLSKPNAVPISPECLQTLRGDERIISILRHQNLLKELQQLAAKGASEKARQQKKSSGYPEELSKALEHTGDVDSDTEREKYKEITTEDSTISSTEVHEENNERDREKNTSEEERNSVEDSEPSEHDVTPEEEEDENKEADEPMESNEIGEQEEAVTDEGIDNHITDDINAGEVSEEKHQEEDTHESQELKEEEEHVTKKHHEDAEEYASDDHEEQRSASEIENLAESKNKASQEDMEDETQSKNEDLDKTEDALDAEKKKSSESDEKSQEDDGGIHHLQNDMRHKEDSSQVKESRSEETELSSSKELENSKRWNKMDELAKELTSKKRNVDNESEEEEEDSDRSMKVPLRARKFDFNSRERDTRRSWPHHSNEDSGERILETAFRPTPEEKKDEEGSANRRAEDQELTSLSAIEKELEQVAHKLHELRRV
ncbi:hypothetical protein NDU88_002674 [Pleurodeles waltl]|uniref:Chromogranin-A n=1 Tax=Pleurodeles waltl TaxID=8319 RepID=A0AAV7MPH7_PLEWA|nr:hypothetical protein NDU88_002674 [Pleurodeles waltl]